MSFWKMFWDNSWHYFTLTGAWEAAGKIVNPPLDWFCEAVKLLMVVFFAIALTPLVYVISIGLFLKRTPRRVTLIKAELAKEQSE